MASELRRRIGAGLLIMVVGEGAMAGTLSRSGSTSASRTSTPVAAPAATPPPAPTPVAPASPLIASIDVLTANFFGPQLVVYGQRAVLYWRADSDLTLSVAFGPTPALGSTAVEAFRLDASLALRGGTPSLVLHQVALDGLSLDSAYYYRGTLSRKGVAVADTGTHPFETPLAFALVRPVEIEMHKDGDHDLEVSAFHQELYDNENAGEVYLEWNVKLRSAPGDFPWTSKAKGCYPGGISIPTSFPEHEPDVGTPYEDGGDDDGSDLEYPESDTPSIEGPDDWQDVAGACRAYSYSDPVDVNSAKVGSGDVVELDAEDYPTLEWDLGADLASDDGDLIGQANALPIDADGDGEPDWGPNGPPTGAPEEPPVPEPCAGAAPGSHALVRLATRGQEFDTAPGAGTTLGSLANTIRVINHDVNEADFLCLDLRDEEASYLVGVRAGSDSFRFTTWFQVTLDYRLPGEPTPSDEELAELEVVVVEPE